VGRKVSCTVTTIQDFGAFVELRDGTQSLLHRGEVAKKGVRDMTRYVKKGDVLDLWISELLPDDKVTLTEVEGRIGGTKRRIEDISPNEWLDGEVEKVVSFGAFVMFPLPGGGNMRGLVHISNVRDWHIKDMNDELRVGEKVRVRIEKFDKRTGKINLTMKDVQLPERLEEFVSYERSNTWLTAKVRQVMSFGLVVKVKSPQGDCVAEGLVLNLELADYYTDPFRKYQVGQEVQVRVLVVDYEREHVKLSMVRLPTHKISAADLELFKDLPADKWLEGTTVSTGKDGCLVEVMIPGATYTVEGMLRKAQMTNRLLRPGQEVKVRVVGVHTDVGTLSFSMLPHKDSSLSEEDYEESFWY